LQLKIVEDIIKLKKQRNAVILAHLYERPEMQDIADFVGDSLELSRKARDTEADVIAFCGVRFMGETAKILNPQKIVLMPNEDAGCPMADMVTADDVYELRRKHPNAAVVCYVNSSAEVKAASDICCTSSNAIKVVKSLKEEEIIFVPDKNLGHYVSKFVPNKKFILYSGYCPIHDSVTSSDVDKVRASYPDAPILAHPECTPDVLDMADFIGSTAQIIDYAINSNEKTLIIGTENGVLHQLKKLCKDKEFIMLNNSMVCPDMKKATYESLFNALDKLQYKVELDEKLTEKAYGSLDRMLSVH